MLFAGIIVVSKIWQNFELKMTFVILFLHVVFPFAFLKNSSKNKQRLVDASVLNIIQNIIGAREKKRIYPSLEVATVAATLDVNCGKKTIPFGDVIELSYIESLDTLHVASTSDDCVFSGPEKKEVRTNGESSVSDEYDTVNFRDDIHSLLAGEILEMMKNNIDVEYRFIFYLRELLRLEEVANSKYGPPLENFDINRLDQVHFSRRQKAKNSEEHKNEKSGIVLENEKIGMIENYFDELNIKFLGNFSMRRDKRKTTLKHFSEHLKDRTSYNKFLNYLLNLEEGFIQ